MSFDEGIDLKQKLNVEYIALKQMDRLNQAQMMGDEVIIKKCLRSLVSLIPPINRQNILDRENEYIGISYIWSAPKEFPYLSKDPKNPLIINRVGVDLDYDPKFNGRRYENTEDGVKEVYEVGGPHQVSPIYIENVDENLDVYSDIIQDEYLSLGLTWTISPRDKLKSNPNPNDPEGLTYHPLYSPNQETSESEEK
jgi:hypothetical protein